MPRADLVGAYLDHLRAVFPEASSLKQFRLGVDCANGATTTVAPDLLEGLGLDIVVIGNQPDGRNINLNCGSTHPDLLARAVVERGCQMGVAFDGDGDRAIFVDHTGRIVDGDAVLLMCGTQLQREGRLKGNAIVATVMSNIGLELALRALGIDLVRTDVGDKYVMEEMQKRGVSLGGEQSGHVIFSDYLFTGDGLCTALNVLRTVALSGRSLADLASDLTTYPQVLMNVRVRDKVPLTSVAPIADAMARVEAKSGARPAAGEIFRHRAGAARDAERDQEGLSLGSGDSGCRLNTSRIAIARSTQHLHTTSMFSFCQRQQGRNAAQRARRSGAERARSGRGVHCGGRAGHYGAPARGSAAHHARRRAGDRAPAAGKA